MMNDKEILELSQEWSIDYKPFEDNLTPQQYAQYGFEQGMKRASCNQIKMCAIMSNNNYYQEETVHSIYSTKEKAQAVYDTYSDHDKQSLWIEEDLDIDETYDYLVKNGTIKNK